MLRTSGLVVTLGFLKSRKEQTDQWLGDYLYEKTRSIVSDLPATIQDLFAAADTLPSNRVSEASGVALIVADHLKRAAEVLLPSPTGSDQ